MKVYLAGNNFHGIKEVAIKKSGAQKEREVIELLEERNLDESYNRLVSFFYRRDVMDILEIKEELGGKKKLRIRRRE